MPSINFEFLRPKWKELAALGAFAEEYARPDPSSCLVKLRSFAEEVVEFIYHEHGLSREFSWHLHELLNNQIFKQAVPRVVLDKLHSLRMAGNKAAHGSKVGRSSSLGMLEEAFHIGCWLHVAYAGGSKDDCGAFQVPVRQDKDDSSEGLKKEKKAILQKLAAQEAELRRVLKELETARADTRKAEATADDLARILQSNQTAANALNFDEEATRRRIIDALLVSANWDVGAQGANTEQITQEEEIEHQPTTSGKGYADYVLWGDDGRPLAVIEAKKTAKDPAEGRRQAKCYADGLEQMYGQRPVIFYTNGYETTLWNDYENEPPRRVFGFYSKDSLEYMVFQRVSREMPTTSAPASMAAEASAVYATKSLPGRIPPKDIEVNPDIVDRMYQIESVKRVIERFSQKRRKALIAQATGTGKTRVAVALCEALVNARWVKRILFLCDRRVLRKQAKDVFDEFLSGDPAVYVTSQTYKQREHRIYLATYPAMAKVYETFDVGFFDLIIADESHRSIYNRYRDIFQYFDAFQIGLTATPIDHVFRSTYKMFDCDFQDPTAHYSYDEAINHNPPYLVPFKVFTHTTDFLRRGIKYSQMSEDQRKQLEENEKEPEAVEHEQHEVDRAIFNKDTNRHILRNLMANGVRVNKDSPLGKTIIFARNHNHAKLLEKLFDEMYPQYGGKVCRVIDNYEPRAQDLIDEFKQPDSELIIAISVDMLDTGVDIPEVTNLVFAKPIYSYVKFWQMIGRGTRLCKDLLGPGKDKPHFFIFDHWGNFEYFDEKYQEAEPNITKPIIQRLFESRIAFAELALSKADVPAFELAVELIHRDVQDLPERAIAVQEKWKQVLLVQNEEHLKQFEAAFKGALLQDIAPLMKERNVRGLLPAYAFDWLLCRMQTALLRNSAHFDDLKAELLGDIDRLRMNLSQVKAKSEIIQKVRSQEFWDNVTIQSLEDIRNELRGIMKFKEELAAPKLPPKVIDVEEDEDQIERAEYKPKMEGLALAAWRQRVESALKQLFESNETLQRIKEGQLVSEDDLTALTSLVLTQFPGLDLNDLVDYYPEVAGHLDLAIRSIIGLDPEAVHEKFAELVQKHTKLTSTQIRFLDMLQNHIARYGSIDLDRLYEAPFTTFDSNGIDGVFGDEEIDDILEIIGTFNPPTEEN